MENESFDQIYQVYFDPVYRYALSLSRDPDLAEEITQETFFKAMRSLDSFRGESSIKSWLCSIARNLLIDHQRKKKSNRLRTLRTFQTLLWGRKSPSCVRMKACASIDCSITWMSLTVRFSLCER